MKYGVLSRWEICLGYSDVLTQLTPDRFGLIPCALTFDTLPTVIKLVFTLYTLKGIWDVWKWFSEPSLTSIIIEDVPKNVGPNLVFGTSFFFIFFSPDDTASRIVACSQLGEQQIQDIRVDDTASRIVARFRWSEQQIQDIRVDNSASRIVARSQLFYAFVDEYTRRLSRRPENIIEYLWISLTIFSYHWM